MIVAAIRKDVALLVHDRGRLLMLIAMPIIFIAVFGSMFKFGPDRGEPRPIAIWHAPGDVRGEHIEKALAASTGFAPRDEPSADAVRAAVGHEEVGAGFVVPATGNIELVIDTGAPVQVIGPLQGALVAVVMRGLSLVTAPPPITMVQPPGVAKVLDGISGFQVTVPGNGVLFGFFIAMMVAMSFSSERHSGTWRRLLAAPVPRWKVLFGKLVPYYLIGCVQLGLIFGLGAGVFGMQVAGSVIALVVLTLMVVLCATSLGVLCASFGWTEKQIGSTVPVMLLVMGLLGGCMFPRLLMPPFMQQLGHCVPHSWALDGYYAVLVRQGTTIVDIAPSLGALAGFSALFAGLGLWRFKFET